MAGAELGSSVGHYLAEGPGSSEAAVSGLSPSEGEEQKGGKQRNRDAPPTPPGGPEAGGVLPPMPPTPLGGP